MRKTDYGLFNKNLLKPSNFKIILKDFFKLNNPIQPNHFHIQEAINWLHVAQKKTKDGGVSLGFSLKSGWRPSYPETSGYIIPTLLDYDDYSKNNNCWNMALKISNWLCSIQLKNGGFQASTIDQKQPPSIFNTGQIIFGLIRAYNRFHEENFLNSAIKAGDFLLKNQEKNGNWIKYCYKNSPHIYNVRTSWALLELYVLTDKSNYREAAVKNLNWAIKQKNEKFWFKDNSNSKTNSSLLHFISYTIRGFLEAGKILKDDYLKLIAFNSSSKLLNFYKQHNILLANYNSNWESEDFYSCLTGDAQLSIIWLKIYEIYKDKNFLISALNLNNYLKSKQVFSNSNKDIDGAIKGSDPIWGHYMQFLFPNWAAKFFCDALILESKIMRKI